VLGKHSGRAALADRAITLGYNLNDEQIKLVFEQFKDLADEKKEVYDGDIVALSEGELFGTTNQEWCLVDYQLISEGSGLQKIEVSLRRGEEEVKGSAVSKKGPVDAAFRAIRDSLALDMECVNFDAKSLSSGEDASVDVTFQIHHKDEIYRGRGVSLNLVEASIMAIINAANRAILHERVATNSSGAAQTRSSI